MLPCCYMNSPRPWLSFQLSEQSRRYSGWEEAIADYACPRGQFDLASRGQASPTCKSEYTGIEDKLRPLLTLKHVQKRHEHAWLA